MKDDHLDKLLGSYRKAPLPREPENLNSRVWREIRRQQNVPSSPTLDFGEFIGWVCNRLTALMAPALALALFVSVGLTMLSGEASASPSIQQRMGFQVFSHQAMPLSRLTQAP